MNASKNCVGLWSCHAPILGSVVYSTEPASCDPTAGTCTVRATVPLEFPGFRNNTTGSGFFDSPAKLNWMYSGGGFAGSCGNVGARIQVEEGAGWIQAGGFSCANPGGVGYAERIVPDPDDSHVWLLTKHATFREFTDAGLDGAYETAVPSDEYRRLIKTGGGWELRDLDGMVHAYDLNGRWLSSTDRNGNAKTATYDVMDRLERVAFPDGRHEIFTYDGAGRLETITEVGVDGISTRVWTYTWTGDDLTGIDRPDGRAWSLLYDAPSHPGFVTRLTLVGDDSTSERVEGAWEFDAQGNVVATWRGATDKTDPDVVDLWQFAFDDPALPVTTTVTDPLGNTSMHTFGRDDTSSKPRLEGISGDCPTNCAGANSSTAYTDAAHPLRPTSITDGRGFLTQMTYDAFGQTLSRTEAFGEPEERTTTWQYDATYPALVTRVERPSTTGDPLDLRVTDYMRDAAGNVTSELHEGVENGAAFSYETVRTYTSEGMPLTIDPPGHGTSDLVTFSYDEIDRGGLVLDDRTDPIIGLTDYGYDAFNRRSSTIDVNGIETTTEFDPANRVRFVRHKGAAGDGSEDLVTENRHTAFGDLFQVVLPEGNVIEYGYDAAGRLLTIERKPDDQPSSHGERVRYELNAYGQRTLEAHERWEFGAWVEHARTAFDYATRYAYDDPALGFGIGRLAAITRGDHSIDYDYDRFGRIIQDGELTFGYDQNGNRTDISYPGGLMATYGFDYADHEATLEVNDGGGAQSIVTSANYLPSGPLDDLVLGNGLEEIRPYDSRYYPDEIRVNDGTTDLLHWSYTVDAVGNPEAIADVLDSANDRSYVYQDYQYFLTQLANIIVHELAHTCGWKHTDGQGVPAVGPNGNS